MNTNERKLWWEGKDLWYEYNRVNGYSFSPSKKGLKELSRLLDLNITYIAKCINIFLNN